MQVLSQTNKTVKTIIASVKHARGLVQVISGKSDTAVPTVRGYDLITVNCIDSENTTVHGQAGTW